MKIILRPHHLMCINHYVGYGYSEDFVMQMNDITRSLAHNPNQIVVLTTVADDLCSHCPYNSDGICATQDKVTRFDNLTLQYLKLTSGEYRWSELDSKVKDFVAQGRTFTICNDCNWKDICQNIEAKRIDKSY